MIEELISENLRLRKANESDLDSIFTNIWSDEIIAGTRLWKPTETRKEAEERMAKTMVYQAENDAFFVCLKETDEAIGFAGVKETQEGVYEETGICIDRAHQRKGYGKELLNVLIDLVFDRRNGKKFVYGCFHENEASAALCKSCGFVYSHSEKMKRDWDGYEYVCDFYELEKAHRQRKGKHETADTRPE